MKKKILILTTILIISLTGCSKEKSEGENTVTPTMLPTPTPYFVTPLIDSGEEEFVEITDEIVDYIKGKEIDRTYDNISGVADRVMSYYEYLNKTDTILPVIISAAPDEVNSLYPGNWIEVDFRVQKDDIRIYSYGTISVEMLRKIDLDNAFENVSLCADCTISGKKGIPSGPDNAYDIEQLRYAGTKYLCYDESGNLIVKQTGYPM